MNKVTIEIEKAKGPGYVTRERRYASGTIGGAAELAVARDGKAFRVYWNARRAAGWFKGWRATKATEAEAFAFAEQKWSELVAWLQKQSPEQLDAGRNGAVDAFSAQVANMTR
jgi:hypothetical protein